MTLPASDVLLQAVLSGLMNGSMYALIAVGLTLIFGLMEVVNFAHGDFMMFAMYIVFWFYTLFSIDPMLSLPAVVVLMFIMGVLTYYLIIKPVLKAPMMAQIFATFGLMVLVRNGAAFLWTPDYRMIRDTAISGRISIFGAYVGQPELIGSVLALVAFALLFMFITRTRTGRAMQATAENRNAAALVGIDSDRMYALGCGIGSACVGVAGTMLATYYPIHPEVGFLFGLIAYVVVVLGGFGSILGALAGGLLVGFIEVVSGLFLPPVYKYAIMFAVFLATLILRPQGLFGKF